MNRPTLLASLSALLAAPASHAASPLFHAFRSVAIAPDGAHVASIEGDDVPVDGTPPQSLVMRDRAGHAVTVELGCPAGDGCTPSDPVWNASGTRLAFLLELPDGTTAIESTDASARTPTRDLVFAGPLDDLRFGPNDRLAVLATADAHKRVGATAPAAEMVGDVGASFDAQRIAVVDRGALAFVSPADLYVYEYDWRPDGGFVGTAATGNGDSNWWIGKLIAFAPDGAAHVLFTPGPREQLASPRVSPDGGTVAFVGGWMSDFGSTGGDAYTLALASPKAGANPAPVDLTPGLPASITSLDWHCRNGLTAAALAGSDTRILALAAGSAPRTLWSGQSALAAGGWNMSLSCAGATTAAIAAGFATAPEIVVGPIGAWQPITHVNTAMPHPFAARSVRWTNDGRNVQGWLLSPNGVHGPRPLVVDVHGGPEAASTPEFPSPRGMTRALLAQGYDVFMPNYRGSFGQGEDFASASIGDLGGGDWRDVLTGVDAAEHAAPASDPIDDRRLGIIGGSYGGYMAMWAVTQTHRFAASVADAGVSDWLSIEGEAPQAGSDAVNFGGSVYDDDAPYLRASPITHMRKVATPVLITVGERDVECPAPQSEEFHTALVALGVPTVFHVYKGEGHAFRREADRVDFVDRSVGWFARWFAVKPATGSIGTPKMSNPP